MSVADATDPTSSWTTTKDALFPTFVEEWYVSLVDYTTPGGSVVYANALPLVDEEVTIDGAELDEESLIGTDASIVSALVALMVIDNSETFFEFTT